MSSAKKDMKNTQNHPVISLAIAGGIESFYRSGMNSLINQKLTGNRTYLFPNMHIQIPVRASYFIGIKQLRVKCDDLDISKTKYQMLTQMLLSFSPGIIMCPFSSILEASNAGEINKESIIRRWTRGYTPRLAREILFGLGINQFSEYTVKNHTSKLTDNVCLAGVLGNCTAGILSGYISHIPHNLSAMKLFNPRTSYKDHWKILYMKSIHLVPSSVPYYARQNVAQIITVLFPIGVVRRSLQIGGTFIIINSIIFLI